jgi:hypothetical protein
VEIPSEVLVHCEALGVKGSRATLVRLGPEGYYEVNMAFGERLHRVLLPIQGTVLISREPETSVAAGDEIER